MTPNVAMNVYDANLDFSSGSSFATNNRPANNEFHMNNSANNLAPVTTVQPQPLTASAISLPNFAATIVPINPLQNATQPVFVQQIATPQPVMNLVQPIPIPAVPIPLRADAMQQNLFLQQQQQAQLQLQQQQQAQLQLQQLHHFQPQQQVFPVASVPQQIPTAPQPIIHNLIPEHLQQASHSTTMLNGTTGCAPALILPSNEYVNAVNMMLLAATSSTTVPGLVPTAPQPIQQQQQQNLIVPIPLTVQDRPSNIPPVFNGINPAYPGIETLGVDPPLFLVRDFLSHAECDFLIRAADGVWQPAPVVGKGAGEISPSRTSSTCFLAREDLPDYMKKVSALTSKPIDHCELPQVGRYLPSQQYRHHFDAFDLSNEDGRRFAQNGGQRLVTVLVYLNDCAQGGQTDFPAMNIQVSPRKGTAVVFFPATVDGYLDKRALHAALPAVDTKYVSQVWIRQGVYTGSPSKRLAQPMVNVLT